MNYDVIIAGFGTSGSLAAIAAARAGMEVLVLEKNTYGGGTHTGGHICGYYDSEPDGLTKELNLLVAKKIKDSGYLHPDAPQEIKIMVYEEEVLKNGGTIIYEACITNILMEGKTFKGVVWYDEKGKHTANAKILIDGSGDAIFCEMAGAQLEKGRKSDGLCQNFTNSSAYLFKDMHVWTLNPDAGRINQNDSEDFSKMMLKTATRHLHDTFSDKPKRLIKACDLPGLREGQRIIAETPMSFKDSFDENTDIDSENNKEPIAWTNVILDNHSRDVAFEDYLFQDWEYSGTRNDKVTFAVQRGTIIPKGIKGILVAGRHLGVDHNLSFSIRMNGCLSKIGEVAGVLSALSVKLNLSPMEVPYSKLDNILQLKNTDLQNNDHIWKLNDDAIIEGLASDLPGHAIWSIRCSKNYSLLNKIIETNSENSVIFRNAIIAMGMIDHPESIPFLQKIAKNCSTETIKGLKRIHYLGYIAVYLLGRLADKKSISIIENILNNSEIEHKCEYHSNGVMALLNIGDKHKETRPKITRILRKLAENPDWYIESRLAPGIMKRRDNLLRAHIAKHLNQWKISHKIKEKIGLQNQF